MIDKSKYDNVLNAPIEEYIEQKSTKVKEYLSVKRYSVNAGREMNKHLRNNKDVSYAMKEDIKSIKTYLAGNVLKKNIRLKRTIIFPSDELKNLKTGNNIIDYGLVSCTTEDYLSHEGIKLDIFMPAGKINGAYIEENSYIKDEKEFLLTLPFLRYWKQIMRAKPILYYLEDT